MVSLAVAIARPARRPLWPRCFSTNKHLTKSTSIIPASQQTYYYNLAVLIVAPEAYSERLSRFSASVYLSRR